LVTLNDLWTRVRLAQFVARLIRGIRESGEPDEVRYDRDQQSILQLRDGEVVGVINQHNLLATYLTTPRRGRAEYIRNCVRMALKRHRELPDDFESTSPNLRPRIRARATLEQDRLRGALMGWQVGLP